MLKKMGVILLEKSKGHSTLLRDKQAGMMSKGAGTDGGPAYCKPADRPANWTDGYIETDGVRLHYMDYGTMDRPTVLCLHGAGAHAHWFDFVAPSLAADYHVLALDQRGHGDSAWADPPDYSNERYAADLAEAVDRLDLHDFTLIGHSRGGIVSLLYAATHPGRVRRLVVADSSMRLTEERIADIRAIGSREGRGYGTMEEFVANYRLRPASTTTRPEVIAYLARYSARRSADGRWRHKVDRKVYATQSTIDNMPYWGRIGIPTLIIKGAHSQRITSTIAHEMKAQCPQVEIVEVPHSDHHITIDNPTGFVDTVRAFLARHQ
jgi:pimeloyl-ACP methyl ester carboxylesterase